MVIEMANMQLLNNIEHKDLRIITTSKIEFGDNVGGSLVFPEEFLQAHREYPLLIQKDVTTGDFQLIALFGFQKDQNLYLTDAGWDAKYIPALMRREPFFIGFQQNKNEGTVSPVIHIDMDSSRVSLDAEGERVFLENGGNTPYLESIKKTLLQVHEGINTARSFLKVLLDNNLVEQFMLDVVFVDESHLKTNNYYTINQEKLMALSGEKIVELHRNGTLQLAYMMLASMGNIKNLVDRLNALAVNQ